MHYRGDQCRYIIIIIIIIFKSDIAGISHFIFRKYFCTCRRREKKKIKEFQAIIRRFTSRNIVRFSITLIRERGNK